MIEDDLYVRWEQFCRSGATSQDGRLRGISAGILCLSEGPDYQGAEFELNGCIYRGDVEIHMESRDWYTHGHHHDSRYDATVLHLVWEEGADVYTSKGLLVYTISMKSLPYQEQEGSCCSRHGIRFPDASLLRRLSKARLAYKIRRIHAMASGMSYDQLLYELLLAQTGTPHNRDPFIRLSKILPWSEIAVLKQKHLELESWLALYLGVGGLLDTLQDGARLHDRFQRMQMLINRKPLPSAAWKRGGHRPGNRPLLRLAGLAHFVHHLASLSLYHLYKGIIQTRSSHPAALRSLEESILTRASGLWKTLTGNPRSLWGADFAREIVANVFLPFFMFESRLNNSSGFGE